MHQAELIKTFASVWKQQMSHDAQMTIQIDINQLNSPKISDKWVSKWCTVYYSHDIHRRLWH